MKRFIIITLIIIVFLNSFALTLFFVVHTHNSFASMRDRNIQDIEQQVINRLENFHVFIEPFEAQARIYIEDAIKDIYGELNDRTNGFPFTISQSELEQLVEEYEGLDLYLIDQNGIVQKSSFKSDIGLNLLKMDESFSEFVLSIYGKGKVFTQRMSVSNMQGTKMIYSYFSPAGSNWIIEASVNFEEYVSSWYSEKLYTHLFKTFFTEIKNSNSDIVEFDIVYQTKVSARSLLTGDEFDLNEKIINELEDDSDFRQKKGDSLQIYRKRSMKRSNFDFVQYPIIFLEYDLSSFNEFIAKFYLIAGVSVLILITIFSAVAYKLVEKKLVSRVEELDEVLQRAAYEDYNVRVRYTTRVPELATLASSANKLIEQVRTRESELRLALDEREMLLDEIHHRVKNNLNVVISLLNLQQEQVNTIDDVKDALIKTRNRIYSMALTHEKLYQSENFTDVNMKTYIESFLSTFNSTIGDHQNIQIQSQIDEIELSITHAVPCGIILNELLTNAIQHAFPDGQKGTIKVSFGKTNEHYYKLVMEDNGIGLPEEFSLHESESLGLILVDALIKQLHGTLSIDKDAGTRFLIFFKSADTGAFSN